MLLTIHVKNFALIDEAELNLGEGVQILTGETGAGKSILIDAVTAALGGKAGRDVVRAGADSALVELVFAVDEEDKRKALAELNIPLEEGQLIVSRRISGGRSVCRLNGETVPQSMVRRATELLIDIHGQHEHQSLLKKSKHLEILDEFIRDKAAELKKELKKSYDRYRVLKKAAGEFALDEESRLREIDFCRYEIQEIDSAGLKPGEEEELALAYRRMANSRRIVEGMNRIYQLLDSEAEDSAVARIGAAAREVTSLAEYDGDLAGIQEQLYSIDSLMEDLRREISDYIEEMTFDEEQFRRTEERLDRIRGLQAKYGADYEAIMAYRQEREDRLNALERYNERREQTEKEYKAVCGRMEQLCGQLSEIRKKEAVRLTEAIRQALVDLNFLDVQVEMAFDRLSDFHENGWDEAEFLISLNPGEKMRPLAQVASGGELSRIMLAIKSVLADTDDIPTLIFDEIDTGISGRTAQKVAEKLSAIGRRHQVLCITHLPQIAAMADRHFLIEKGVEAGKTRTVVRSLDDKASVEELARLIGDVQMTDTTYRHAQEMKELARQIKKNKK